MQEALTCNKMLEAARKIKELPHPAPVPMEMIRRPNGVAEGAPLLFHRVNVHSMEPVPISLKLDDVDIQPVLLDSFYLPGLLQKMGVDPAALEGKVGASGFVPRDNPAMKYRSNELSRDKCFYVRSEVNDKGEPTTLFKYKYPGFQYKSMQHYKPFSAIPELSALIDALQAKLQVNGAAAHFNHAIGTQYRLEKDNIGYHSDDMTDITRGTPIVSISLGDAREFHFCEPGAKKPKFVQVLRAGDVFVLGPQTNAALKHAVPPIAKEKELKREPGAIAPRTSIVLRNIRTKLTRAEMIALAK
jgi:alkylated DNA repair dioxygenase AlkB